MIDLWYIIISANEPDLYRSHCAPVTTTASIYSLTQALRVAHICNQPLIELPPPPLFPHFFNWQIKMGKIGPRVGHVHL